MARILSTSSATQLEFALDSYLTELETLDVSIGAHLLNAALTPATAACGAGRGSPAWWRDQVRAWCGLASTAASFDPEAVGSAAMAAEHMEDELLMPWIRSLLSAGADVRVPTRPAA